MEKSSLVVMSEDMVADGYEDIMNVDISSVAIDMMKRKYEHIPQLKCILLKTYFIKPVQFCTALSLVNIADSRHVSYAIRHANGC